MRASRRLGESKMNACSFQLRGEPLLEANEVL